MGVSAVQAFLRTWPSVSIAAVRLTILSTCVIATPFSIARHVAAASRSSKACLTIAHAQPIVYPVCGHRLWLESGVNVDAGDPIDLTLDAPASGKVAAIRGIGDRGRVLDTLAGSPDLRAFFLCNAGRPQICIGDFDDMGNVATLEVFVRNPKHAVSTASRMHSS